MFSVESLFIQFRVKWNDTTCLFIFSDRRNSLNILSTERRFFRPKTLETIQFWRFPLEFSLSAEIMLFWPKDYFDQKHEIGTENKNQRIAPILPELRRLRTPANTENSVLKMTPSFPKLNLLLIPIICFHFLYFYLILFLFFVNHYIIFSANIMIQWNEISVSLKIYSESFGKNFIHNP